ncbi:MAG: hypothetical protein LIO93_04320 [Bacteroidales bacterium]|nr:hypothetical protein [Bacteroidales bacterium]
MKKVILFTIIILTATSLTKAQNYSGYISLCSKYQFNEDIFLPVHKSVRLGSQIDSLGSRIKLSVNPDHGGVFDYFPTLYVRAGKTNGDGFTYVMTLKENGNIGINTTTPTYKLHVNGDAKVNNNLRVAGTQYGKALVLGNETDSKNHFRMYFSEGSSTKDSYMQYGGHLYFYSNELGTYTAMMHKNGDFHIGWSANKAAKRNLLVNGTVKAIKLETKVDVWSDFVFHDNYDLPSIGEVKSHIKEHKHLPGIPSEKEVLENGIDVADMQAKLLQKIEELTLYTIQQQELIDEQKESLSEQKKMFDELKKEVDTIKENK